MGAEQAERSFAVAAACLLWWLDILKLKEIEEETNTWPLNYQERFAHIKSDLRDFTYHQFQNVVCDYLGIKVTSLSTVHISSPCMMYMKAHHSKHPH